MARVLTPIKNTHTQVASPLQGPPLRGEVHLFGSLNVAFVGQLEGGGGGWCGVPARGVIQEPENQSSITVKPCNNYHH